MAHVTIEGLARPIEIANIFCIGRNYAAHVAELGNRPAQDPVVFIKPTSAILNAGGVIELPRFSNDVHYEAELVMLVGKGGKNIDQDQALEHIAGYGLGLDLTARDLQTQAKKAGLPWAVGKGFDGSACVSGFVPASRIEDPLAIEFQMQLNGVLKQHGEVRKMLFPLPFVIAYLSRVFTLQAGDLIYTGTPEGVGPLTHGDHLQLSMGNRLACEFSVA